MTLAAFILYTVGVAAGVFFFAFRDEFAEMPVAMIWPVALPVALVWWAGRKTGDWWDNHQYEKREAEHRTAQITNAHKTQQGDGLR